jgi:hypothetical protein
MNSTFSAERGADHNALHHATAACNVYDRLPKSLLEPQVKLPKRLDQARDAVQAEDALPELMVTKWIEVPFREWTVDRLQPLLADSHEAAAAAAWLLSWARKIDRRTAGAKGAKRRFVAAATNDRSRAVCCRREGAKSFQLATAMSEPNDGIETNVALMWGD